MVGGRQTAGAGKIQRLWVGMDPLPPATQACLAWLGVGLFLLIGAVSTGKAAVFYKSEIDGTQPSRCVRVEDLEPGIVPFEFQEHFAWRVSWYMAGLQSMLGSSGLWGGRGWGQGAPSGLRSNPHASATLCFNSLLPPSGK